MFKKGSLILAVMLFLMASLLLTSCSLGDSGKGRYDFDDGDKSKDQKIVLSDLEEYTIVRGDLCSDKEKHALVTFRDTVNKNLGLKLSALTDWIGEGQPEHEKEILIGETNRKESISAMKGLGYNDFVIKKIGTKLVIAGGSGTATIAAVDYFIENYINIFDATLSYPKDGYSYKQTYMISSITIDGKPIEEYDLYTADPEIDLVPIQSALSDMVAGAYLEIETELNSKKNYIIFSRTNLISNEFKIFLEDDGNLYICASAASFDSAIEYFKGPYFSDLSAKKGSSELDITWHDNLTKKTKDFKMYSKEALLSTLLDVYEDRNSIIIGENLGATQLTPAYTLENFHKATGEYPAIIGIDLGCYGLRISELTLTEWSEAICSLSDYASRGGIITATSCFENPTGNWPHGGKCYGTLGGEEAWEELLTEGSELNKKFKEELSINAAFLSALRDNGVNILWRPLQDTNTDIYWFSAISENGKVSGEYIKRLWIYIFDYFNSIGLDNLIWVYSPSVTNGEENTLDPLYAYPGDEYVDIVGCDVISNGENEINGKGQSYTKLVNDTKKIGAICSFTLKNGGAIHAVTKEEQSKLYSGASLLNQLYALRSEGYSFSYIMTGGTSSLSWIGNGEQLTKDEMILTLSDIAKRFGIN